LNLASPSASQQHVAAKTDSHHNTLTSENAKLPHLGRVNSKP